MGLCGRLEKRTSDILVTWQQSLRDLERVEEVGGNRYEPSLEFHCNAFSPSETLGQYSVKVGMVVVAFLVLTLFDKEA